MERTCKTCGFQGGTEHFAKAKGCLGGVRPVCVTCSLKERAAWYQKVRDPSWARKNSYEPMHDFFSCIGSPMKAYLLGLLMADGHISAKDWRIRLKVKASDEELPTLLRDHIAPGALLYRYDALAQGKRHPQISLEITSHRMCDDLGRLGLHSPKTGNERIPDAVDPALYHAFILGYFDGDGCVSWAIRKNRGGLRRVRWSMVSASLSFVTQVQEVLARETGITTFGPYYANSATKTCHQIGTQGAGAFAVDAWLHQSGLGMKRKTISLIALPNGAPIAPVVS